MFGVWVDSLIRDLLWINRGKFVNSAMQYTRPINHQVPSWSWASVNSAVRFLKSNKEPSAILRIQKENRTLDAEEDIFYQSSGYYVIRGHGYLAQIPSIKCSPQAAYDGFESRSCQLDFLGNRLKTYLDSIKTLEKPSVPS